MLKYRLKNFSLNLLQASGQDKRLLRQIRQQNLLVVLNFHRVAPHSNPFWSPLSPRLFEDLLIFLKQHFQIVLFRDLPNVGKDKPTAILSFDDGYYDFIEYALPLLEKHNLKANMNVVVKCLETGMPPWIVRLYDFLNRAPRKLVNESRPTGFDVQLEGEDDASKLRYGLQISRFLIDRPVREREEMWQTLAGQMGRGDFAATRMMNISDVRSISADHEIGAHSFSHESMEFQSDEFFLEDFRLCSRFFREELQMPLLIYAFPNGSHRKEQIQILTREKVKHILLVGEEYSRNTANVHSRFTIYGSSALENKFQALGFNNQIKRWRETLRRGA